MHRFFFFCLVISIRSYGQYEDSLFIRKLADEILVNSKAYDNLRVLCKTIGGRLAGSPQMHKAEEWGVRILRASGADQVYLQQCMVPHWVRGGKDEAYINFKNEKGNQVKQYLDVLALGNSIGTGKNGVKAPVILINDFTELENRKNEIKGKIVFYNYAFNPRYIRTGQAYGEAGIYRRSGPSRAAKYGAVAVLIRSMSGSVDNNPHTGATLYDSSLPKIPCAAMGLRDADHLCSVLKDGGKVQAYLRTMAQFLPDTVGHNVIGELKGSEFPDEFITVGGHLDSWDPAEGAHDDGTGIVQSIDVLRTLKAIGYKPRHTIRVVLFANEENGLRGAHKYADDARARNEKHLFALESDGGGFTPRGFDFAMSPIKLNNMRQWLPLFKEYGVYEFTAGSGGSDVDSLNKALGTPVSELRPDPQRYFDIHHARNDVFENVNKRELELGTINMTALIYLIDKYGL